VIEVVDFIIGGLVSKCIYIKMKNRNKKFYYYDDEQEIDRFLMLFELIEHQLFLMVICFVLLLIDEEIYL
jgi:hypothetical protein